MHVVVTGAAGFIGSHTCECLVGLGHRVTGLDSFDGYLYPAEVKRANALELGELEQFELVEGDFCDPAIVARVIDRSASSRNHGKKSAPQKQERALRCQRKTTARTPTAHCACSPQL